MNKKILILFLLFTTLCMPSYAYGQPGENITSAQNENLITIPGNLPQETVTTPVPIENVRPPDLTIPKENFENISPYQAYVTPYAPAVQNLASGVRNVEEAYYAAVSWVWVSDLTLNGVEEKWLYPQEFMSNTPNYPANPAHGRVSSDCEEQAYTLVSLVRAIGVQPEYVRVAVGKVRFGDQEGGHAWAEIYVENRWMALEATSGPYWDDDNHMLFERNGLPYDYFGFNEYPSIEVWAYFNDAYYFNTSTGEGNAPANWRTYWQSSRFDWVLMGLLLTFAVALVTLITLIVSTVYKRKRY